MRIIAGEFRGRLLKAPKGMGTRPTTDRVRESIMNIVTSACGGFENMVVLDAFAGSGALGFEALSRGARCVHFFENEPEAFRTLAANMHALKLESPRIYIHKVDIFKEPPLLMQSAFDLIFLDPPYAYAASDVLNLVVKLREAGALCSSAIIVYEHASASSDEVARAARDRGFSFARRKKYSDTMIEVLWTAQTQNRDIACGEEWD